MWSVLRCTDAFDMLLWVLDRYLVQDGVVPVCIDDPVTQYVIDNALDTGLVHATDPGFRVYAIEGLDTQRLCYIRQVVGAAAVDIHAF